MSSVNLNDLFTMVINGTRPAELDKNKSRAHALNFIKKITVQTCGEYHTTMKTYFLIKKLLPETHTKPDPQH